MSFQNCNSFLPSKSVLVDSTLIGKQFHLEDSLRLKSFWYHNIIGICDISSGSCPFPTGALICPRPWSAGQSDFDQNRIENQPTYLLHLPFHVVADQGTKTRGVLPLVTPARYFVCIENARRQARTLSSSQHLAAFYHLQSAWNATDSTWVRTSNSPGCTTTTKPRARATSRYRPSPGRCTGTSPTRASSSRGTCSGTSGCWGSTPRTSRARRGAARRSWCTCGCCVA